MSGTGSDGGQQGGQGNDKQGAQGEQGDQGQGNQGAAGQGGQQQSQQSQGGQQQGSGGAQQPTWRDDWRGAAAKGDDAKVKRLERYKDPESAFEALFSAQDSISKHGLRTPLPENATPEQVAEYRKINGVPETHDKYSTDVGNGYVWGEADKPLLDGFLKHMHGEHATPGEVNRGLRWYAGVQKQLNDQRAEQDATFKQDSLAKLGEMYKGEFKRNVAHVDAFLDSPEFPAGIKDKILGARLPNGRLAGSDPEFIDFLYQQAIFRNPIATVMGGNSETQIKTAETRLNELIKMSGDKDSDYNKGPNKEALRNEHLKLIEDLDKVKAGRR